MDKAKNAEELLVGSPFRIVLTGPESSGKTTLARQLARHYGTVWTQEYARHYLARLERPYEAEDLLRIAEGQLEWEARERVKARRVLFCDTGLLVVKVWYEVRYGEVHPWLEDQLARQPYDLYLLCRPDLSWAPDPLREHPDAAARDRLFAIYQRELLGMNAAFAEISRPGEDRLRQAIAAVEGFLKSHR